MAPSPCTEVARLPFKAGTDVTDSNTNTGSIWQECATTILDQPGAQRMYFGHEEEDKSIFWLLIDWDSYDSHKAFMDSRAYQPFLKNLGTLMDGPPQMNPVTFDNHPKNVLSDSSAPVAEILYMYFATDISDSEKDKVAQGVKKFPIPRPGAIGWTIDDALYDQVEGGKARALVVLCSFGSVEEHKELQGGAEFKDAMPLILEAPGIKGLRGVHCKFTELQGNAGNTGGLSVEERGGEGRGGVVQEEVLNPQ